MQTFSEVIQQQRFALDQAALLLAREVAYPNLNVRGTLGRIETLSVMVAARLAPDTPIREQIARLNHFLFEEQGFQGNGENYYDPRNSFLNDVLIRHTGIPITLSVLYISVARRLGLLAYGVGLPGHFMVGCKGDGETLYIDAFRNGQIMDAAACEALGRRYLASGQTFSPEYLCPQPRRAILERMLNNLRQIYLSDQDMPHLLRVMLLQSSLNPSDMDLYRDIGVVSYQAAQWGQAVRALRGYLYRQPTAPDHDSVKDLLHEALGKLSQLN